MKATSVFHNAKWIIICKIIQSLLQLVVGILCARYLGPDNYGLINYASSVVAFAIPFAMLGLNATLVQELIESPDMEGEIMGTSVIMGIVSSIFCSGLVGLFVSVANKGETETFLVCLLYSTSLFFQAIELIQYWFHAKLKSKYPSIMMLCAYVIVSAYKIYILILQKSIYWFAVVHSIEYGIIGFSLILFYHREASQKLSFSISRVYKLFHKSRHYILASLMATIFQNTDHIMLKTITGDAENGFYAAAITCVSVCQFVYIAIIDSVRPGIISSKKAGSSEYKVTISKLYCVIIYLALTQSIVFFVFAKQIIWLLYGYDFFAAIPVLRILVWYVAFSCMGVIRNVWILAEEKHSILWKINLAGILVNVFANAMLIPRWGASGAATASMLTQLFTNFILGFFYKPIQENNKLLIKGLNPNLLIGLLKK